MSVQVATLDMLVDRAHLEPEVARAIGDAIVMEINHARGSLVTQDDLKLAKDELIRELLPRGEFEARMRKIDERMENGFAALRLDMERLRADMARWMLTSFLSMFGLILGVMYVMLKLQ